MDDKTLFSPQRPTPSISLAWLLVTLGAVLVGAVAVIVVLGGASDAGRSLGPGLVLFAVTIVAALGGTRQAFQPLAPAVSVAGPNAVPVVAEVVAVNLPGGMTFGTFTVRFAAAAGSTPQEAEMLMTTPGKVGQQIPGRFDPMNPGWVVADGPNIVAVLDQAFKGTIVVGVLLLVCAPFV